MTRHETDVATIKSLVRALLDQGQFAGREELITQVDAIEYVSGPVTMMDLHVPRTCPASPDAPSPVPNSPTVIDHDGEMIGLLLLWLEDGYISCLEYAWVTDEMPTALPSTDQLARR